MNLFQIRKNLIDHSGRFDLVVDTTNYVDAGANYWINEGSKLLDSIQEHQQTVLNKQVDIVKGDHRVLVKDLRAVKGVYVTDGTSGTGGTEGRTKLERKDLDELKGCYAAQVDALDQDRPAFYAADAIIGLAPEQVDLQTPTTSSDELVENPSFDDPYRWEDTGVLTAGTVEIQEGAVKFSGATTATVAGVRQEVNIVPGRSYQVQYTIANYSVGICQPRLGGTVLTGAAVNGLQTETVVAGDTNKYFEVLAGLALTADVTLVSVKEVVTHPYTDEFTHDEHDLVFDDDFHDKRAIIFMPPADKAYTMIINGRFWSRKLVDDSDLNYWSVNHPNLLEQAARTVIEMSRRNTSGTTDFMKAMEPFLRGINKDLVEDDIAEYDGLED